jgi:hypothetical protein
MKDITNYFGVSLGSRDLDDDTMALTTDEKASVMNEVYARNTQLQCRATGYATLTAYTEDGGVWILEGSKDNHNKYVAVLAEDSSISHEKAIQKAGGLFYNHCKFFLFRVITYILLLLLTYRRGDK